MIYVTKCPLLCNRPSILPQHLCFFKRTFVCLGFRSEDQLAPLIIYACSADHVSDAKPSSQLLLLPPPEGASTHCQHQSYSTKQISGPPGTDVQSHPTKRYQSASLWWAVATVSVACEYSTSFHGIFLLHISSRDTAGLWGVSMVILGSVPGSLLQGWRPSPHTLHPPAASQCWHPLPWAGGAGWVRAPQLHEAAVTYEQSCCSIQHWDFHVCTIRPRKVAATRVFVAVPLWNLRLAAVPAGHKVLECWVLWMDFYGVREHLKPSRLLYSY